MIGSEAAALLDALHEPAIVVDRTGTIVGANRAFRRALGSDASQRQLSELLNSSFDALELYLSRCLGSSDALVGALDLWVGAQVKKAQCKGSAVRNGEGSLILLRLTFSSETRFVALTQTVAELKEELRKRRRSEAMLEESVSERELLLRELEHRVKNNMQMLSALLSGAEREASSAEAKAALKDASCRFSAVSAVQQLLYRSESLATIESQALVSTLTDAVSTLASKSLKADVVVDPFELPIDVAVPIGLILNELLTNALKHGRPATGSQSLHVAFGRHDGVLRLTVEDNGPGFDLAETSKRASGIGLVRGLLRQLGGAIEVQRSGGSCCTVTFPEPKAAATRILH
ncbi:histidine kinase dimerization/phosphoacceptor domain -containing protein [Novosphingobium sp. RD2P27]|uniref:histidine kinase n=1 Tax=Novosphingobium kalidii TaxID=3230299 RepID=A0ABV2D1Q5_9SPHN